MKKKITTICIKILILLSFLQMVNIPTVKASSFWDNVFQEGKSFVDKGKDASSGTKGVINDTNLKETNTEVYNVLLAAGIVLAVIIGGILGIQILWGSIEQQVKAKEMLMPYVAGCLVIFGAFTIWKICLKIFSQL